MEECHLDFSHRISSEIANDFRAFQSSTNITMILFPKEAQMSSSPIRFYSLDIKQVQQELCTREIDQEIEAIETILSITSQ